MHVELTVCGMCDIVCKFSIDKELTVLHVKKHIIQINNVPVQDQRLFHNTEELKNSVVLSSLLARPGSEISKIQLTFIRRPAGQAQWLREVRASENALANAPEIFRDDRAIALAAVEYYPSALRYMSETIRSDPFVVLTALKKDVHCSQTPIDGFVLTHASEKLTGDIDFMMELLEDFGSPLLAYATSGLWSNKPFALIAMQADGLHLRNVANYLKADREVVKTAFSTYPPCFQFAAEELKRDRDFVLQILPRFGKALEWVGSELQADRDVVLSAVRHDGGALKFAANDLKADRELIRCACDYSISAALEHATDEVKSDRNFILQVLTRSGTALQWAVGSLQADRDVVLTAVRQNGHALKFASEDLRNDPFVVMTALHQSDPALAQFADALKTDPDIVRAFLASNRDGHRSAKIELRADRQTVLAAVGIDGSIIKFLPSFKADRQIALEAVRSNMTAFKYIAHELRYEHDIALAALTSQGRNETDDFYRTFGVGLDRQLALAAVQVHGAALKNIATRFQADREIVLAAVQQNGLALAFADQILRADLTICVEALKNCGAALEFVAQDFKSDRELVLLAVVNCPQALEFAAPDLRSDRDIVLVAVSNDRSVAMSYTVYGNSRAHRFAHLPGRLGSVKQSQRACLKSEAQARKMHSPALRYASETLRSDRQVVLTAVSTNGRALRFASHVLRAEREIVLVAVTRSGFAAIVFASQKLRNDTDMLALAGRCAGMQAFSQKYQIPSAQKRRRIMSSLPYPI